MSKQGTFKKRVEDKDFKQGRKVGEPVAGINGLSQYNPSVTGSLVTSPLTVINNFLDCINRISNL